MKNFLEEGRDIGREQFYGDGQKNDTEELTEDIHASFTEDPLGQIQVSEDKIDNHHIEDYRRNDVLYMILRSQGEHSGECSCSGNEREDNGNNGGGASWTAVFEDFDIQDHLACKDQENDGAGHGEGLYVHAEQGQNGISQEEEEQENYGREYCGLARFYLEPFVLESYYYRCGAGDVYHGEEYHEGTQYFLDAEMKFHAAKVRKMPVS